MTFLIRFRCTECGREQLVDLDDRKLTHIICPDRECRHYAPKPEEDLLDELHQDQRSAKIMNFATIFLLFVFFGGIILAFSTFWPDAQGQVSNIISTNAYIGFCAAFAAFVGIIIMQVRVAHVDTACDY